MYFRAGVFSLGLLLLSRALGLLRESAQAVAFGSIGMGDAVIVMFTLPDLLVGILVSGALTYAAAGLGATKPERSGGSPEKNCLCAHAGWAGAGLAGLAWLGLAWLGVCRAVSKPLPLQRSPIWLPACEVRLCGWNVIVLGSVRLSNE